MGWGNFLEYDASIVDYDDHTYKKDQKRNMSIYMVYIYSLYQRWYAIRYRWTFAAMSLSVQRSKACRAFQRCGAAREAGKCAATWLESSWVD